MSGAAPPLQPILFGPEARRLFGLLHSPPPEVEARHGVVLCNAFGQEAVRAHRMLRVLAERLARTGHPVLRFDYHGTGDSPGDDLDADLDGWATDVHAADHELRDRSGARATVWVGMRLGGAIALRAARHAPRHLLRLVLWDPVLDGARYLAFLRRRHVDSLQEAFSVPPDPSPADVARDPTAFRDEAIGFALPARLRGQLEALRADAPDWPHAPVPVVAIGEPDGEEAAALAVALATLDPSSRPSRIEVRHGVDWTTDVAGDGALVPSAALMALAQHAGAPP